MSALNIIFANYMYATSIAKKPKQKTPLYSLFLTSFYLWSTQLKSMKIIIQYTLKKTDRSTYPQCLHGTVGYFCNEKEAQFATWGPAIRNIYPRFASISCGCQVPVYQAIVITTHLSSVRSHRAKILLSLVSKVPMSWWRLLFVVYSLV